MGMYTDFRDENLNVLDWNGLVRYIETFNKCFQEHKAITEGMLNKGTITFSNWNGMKLISYWYDTTKLFLKGIAKYIDGEVFFTFENDDEAGWIEFKNGECIIHSGVMDWVEWKPERFDDENFKIPQELKDVMLVNEI